MIKLSKSVCGCSKVVAVAWTNIKFKDSRIGVAIVLVAAE